MRFLVTGGAGFIGSNAAHRFREMGHDVVVYDNFSPLGVALQPGLARGAPPRDPVHRRRRPRRRSPAGGPGRAFRRDPPSGGPGGRDDLDRGPRLGLRDQRPGDLSAARGDPPASRGRAGEGSPSDLRLDQQGLRPSHDGRNDPRRPLGLLQSPDRSLGGGIAVLRVPVRLLQGGRGPVRGGLPPQLRPSDGGAAAVLHLRNPAVRRRGPGMGRVVRPGRGFRAADHVLRRRPPGARPALGGRPHRAVPGGGAAPRRRRRQGVQRGRRPRIPPVAQGADGDPGEAPGPPDPGRFRSHAAGRPTRLLLQHRQGGAGARLEAPGRSGAGRRPAARLDPLQHRRDFPLPRPPRA